MDPISAIVSFATSVLANNIPTVQELLTRNQELDKRVEDCSNKARKQWKCKAARDLYEGKDKELRSDLLCFLQGKKIDLTNELQELFSRWVIELKKDPICYAYIIECKIDILAGANIDNGVLKTISDAVLSLDNKIDKLTLISQVGLDTTQRVENTIDKIYADIIRLKEDLSRGLKFPDSNSLECIDNDEALKRLFDIIYTEANMVDTYVIFILNRGGISWFEAPRNRMPLNQSISIIKPFLQDNRFYFSDKAFVAIQEYYEIATELRSSLESLVMAITTAEDQDAITDVYDITYDQDIHCDSKFVQMMMTAFTQADSNPAYEDFAIVYEKHETKREEILAMIDARRNTII